MTKENPRLNLYLGSLKEHWINYCKKSGHNPSTTLRELIKHQLESNAAFKSLRQTKEQPDDIKKQRFEVLLTPSEKAALELCAEQDQCSQRRWVINIIRAGLTKQPQFGMKEIEVLGDSNYQLLRIGCNLNQIAKVLNQGEDKPTNTDDLIQELRDMIKVHVKSVSQALRASLGRWDIE